MTREKQYKTFAQLKQGDKMWMINTKVYPYEIEKCSVREIEAYSNHSFRFGYCPKCSGKYILPCYWLSGGCSELYNVHASEANTCFIKMPKYFFTTVENIAKTEQQLLMAEYDKQISSGGNGAENSIKAYLEDANKRMFALTQEPKKELQ